MEGCGCGMIRVIISPIVIVYLFLTLGAAEEVESIFPACKEKTNAINIPNLVDPNPCIFRCPTKVEMVCANDGTSHINECFLCKDACNNKERPIFKVCSGRCPCKGKPHDDIMKTVEDCKDGKCAVDASDHYDEDYGQDVEAPEAKYTYPEYTQEQDKNGEVIHELNGYTEKGDEDEEEEEGAYVLDEEGLEDWEYEDEDEDGGLGEEGYDEVEEEEQVVGDENEEGEVKVEGEVEGEDKLQGEGEVQGDGKESEGAGDGEGEYTEEEEDKWEGEDVDKKQNDGQDQGTDGPGTDREMQGMPKEGSKGEQKSGKEEQEKDEPVKVVIPNVENKEDVIS